MRLAVVDLAAHSVRVAATATALALVPTPWAVPVATALFLALFSLAHDLAHGALGLPRRATAVALAMTGVAMATSGHAMRRMHLHHHARPMADDDLEGASAGMTLGQAAWRSPRLAIGLRLAAWRRAGRRERWWQLGEHVASVALIGLAVAGPLPLRIHVAIVVAAQLTSPLWAGHIPHRLAGWPLAAVRALAFTRSPTVLSLAFHDRHHARPAIPCHQLATAASAARAADASGDAQRAASSRSRVIVPRPRPQRIATASRRRDILSA